MSRFVNVDLRPRYNVAASQNVETIIPIDGEKHLWAKGRLERIAGGHGGGGEPPQPHAAFVKEAGADQYRLNHP